MKFIPNAITRKLALQVLVTKKNSPTILFATGVVGVVGTTVLACKATLRVDAILDEAQGHLKDVKTLTNAKYSESDRRQDQTIVYVQSAVKIAKLYAPAIGLGVISVACLTGSHRILTKRNFALTAAYSGLEKAFSEYRQHVTDELGSEKEAEFRHGIEYSTVKDKDGKNQKIALKGLRSEYSRIFEKGNPQWQETPEYNGMFLRTQQEYANHRLRANGFLLLNDVLTGLGFDRTPAGCVVGWLWVGNGDSYIDFGIGDWPHSTDFVNAREGAVVLDFNVDGIVYDKI